MEEVTVEDRHKVVLNVIETLLGSGQYSAGPQVENTAAAFEQKVFGEASSRLDYLSRIQKKLNKVRALTAAAPVHPAPAPAAVAVAVAVEASKPPIATVAHAAATAAPAFVLVPTPSTAPAPTAGAASIAPSGSNPAGAGTEQSDDIYVGRASISNQTQLFSEF